MTNADLKDCNVLEPILKTDEVIRISGLSRTTLWREIRAGRFPKPIALSPGRVGFHPSSVAEWIQSKRRPVSA